jgi:hypothetical protein
MAAALLELLMVMSKKNSKFCNLRSPFAKPCFSVGFAYQFLPKCCFFKEHICWVQIKKIERGSWKRKQQKTITMFSDQQLTNLAVFDLTMPNIVKSS